MRLVIILSMSESYRHSFFLVNMSSFCRSLTKVIISLFLKNCAAVFDGTKAELPPSLDLLDCKCPLSLDIFRLILEFDLLLASSLCFAAFGILIEALKSLEPDYCLRLLFFAAPEAA